MVACCCLVDRLLRRRCLVQPAAAGMHEPPVPPACTRLTVQINGLPLAAHIPPYIQLSLGMLKGWCDTASASSSHCL